MERIVREFLGALRRLTSQYGLYPDGHPLTDEVIGAVVRAADGFHNEDGEAVLTLLDDALYIGPALLAHASLEHNGLLRDMQSRGIDSLTLLEPLERADISDLGAFVAGVSDDIPAAGSVRLNERPLTRSDLETSELQGLRSSYAASLDVLRGVGFAMRSGSEFELSGVTWAVQNLVEQSVAQPGASLLLATVKSHDEYTFYHSVNTSIFSLALGRVAGLSEEQLVPMGLGSVLHDIGKTGVSASVLQHPGRLNSEQWGEIKFHPQEGAQAILAAAGPGQEVAAAIALEHHARFDGSGYPKLMSQDDHRHEHNGGGHSADALHFYSRLVSVADTYDAITTRRSYRRAETPSRALEVLLHGAGTSYDPDFVRAFIHIMGAYPAGSLLQLSSGELVMVTGFVDNDPRRPAAVVVRGQDGARVSDPQPYRFDPMSVVDQLLPDRAGIDPASLLERAGVQQALVA